MDTQEEGRVFGKYMAPERALVEVFRGVSLEMAMKEVFVSEHDICGIGTWCDPCNQ